MPLITTANLAKSYGAEDIFSQISLSIPQRARIGLVGANGIGKTTLFRILLGMEEPSEGNIQKSKAVRIGYLPQEADLVFRGTLWEECLGVFNSLQKLQEELARLERAMSDPLHATALLETYGSLQREFDHLGGYTYETRIRQVLAGLGFSPQDYQRPFTQLSGGQRTRAFLGRLLLDDPDLLLLDEPTNHLDISAIEWLESYLRDWRGATLIISHDRYFLNQVCNIIWEMTPILEVYHGNYSAYLQQRAERYQRRLEEFQNQQEFIEKEEEFIRRNIAGQNTRQAQGRRKRLERMLEEARLTPPLETRRIHLHLEPTKRSGDRVLQTHQLSIGYEDEGHPLFDVPDLILIRGECAAIIGPNGAGKTTLLKTLLGQIPPYRGDAVLGASLQIGYFAQTHESLDPEKTPMQEIQTVAPQMLPAQVRDYLAKFLFRGDDVFKQVKVLSGGERGRLALACLALHGANLLLLDEPTNHLDLPSQEILQAILADYRGTILLVSHDRYLIDALATQVWEIYPDRSALRLYDGTYSEYHTSQIILQETVQSRPVNPKEKQKKASPGKNRLRKREMQLEALEASITRLEEQLALAGKQLEKPLVHPEKVHKLGLEYVHLQEQLAQLYQEWETASQAEAMDGG
jgi:ATP-binding cassette subfamily F protein 3